MAHHFYPPFKMGPCFFSIFFPLLQGAVLGRDPWRGGNGAGAADVGGRSQCGGLLGGHGALPGDLGPGKIAMGNPWETMGNPRKTIGKSMGKW